MKSLQTHSRTTPQGILNLALPIGLPSMDVDVIVIVDAAQPYTKGSSTPRQAWDTFVDETAGGWSGDFTRRPQGEFEQREPFA